MSSRRIACLGEAMIELSMAGATAAVGVAGDSLNTAIYLKRSAPSLQVDFVSALGDDPFSDRIAQFIADQDIGTASLSRRASGTAGLYAITTDGAGERSFTYWRGTSAARTLFADGDFDLLRGYDAIYLSGISVAILPQPVRLGLLDWLHGHAMQVVFDSNFRPILWESEAVAREVIGAFWQRADVVLPSIDDEMRLFEETQRQVIEKFQRLGKTGAMKRGAEGPLSLPDLAEGKYPPAPQVIDSTAAGDSFNGGYLGALLTGALQEDALARGHMLARRVVGHRGAILPR